MKKLLFFFSMLFFFSLSKVSALDNYIIDFRSTSTEPLFPNSINYLNNTTCTGSSYCTGTYVETFEKIITSLESQGYSIYLSLGQQDDLFGSSSNFDLYVFDSTKTDLSDLILFSTSGSSSKSFYIKTSDDSPIYYWHFWSNSNFPFNNFNKIIDTVSSSSPDSSNSLEFFNIFYFDTANYYFGGLYPYYLSDSVKFSYDFEDSFDIFTDFVTDPNDPLTLNSSSSFGTNYLFYLRTYIDKDYFSPPDVGGDAGGGADIGQSVIESIDTVNDTLTDIDISGSEGAFNDFFGNFESNDHGLFAIVSTPLNFIKSFINSVCTPLVLPLPFVDQDVTLPCMEYVYTKFFGNFFTAYQTITTGIVAYWVCVNIMRIVKDMKDSEKDTIEVLDL